MSFTRRQFLRKSISRTELPGGQTKLVCNMLQQLPYDFLIQATIRIVLVIEASWRQRLSFSHFFFHFHSPPSTACAAAAIEHGADIPEPLPYSRHHGHAPQKSSCRTPRRLDWTESASVCRLLHRLPGLGTRSMLPRRGMGSGADARASASNCRIGSSICHPCAGCDFTSCRRTFRPASAKPDPVPPPLRNAVGEGCLKPMRII